MTVPLPIIDQLRQSVTPYVTLRDGAFGRETPLPRVTVWSSTQTTPQVPGVLRALFYVVLQGAKVVTVGGNSYTLGPGDWAASAFGVPYVGELIEASLTTPYIAISVDLDADVLNDVMLDRPSPDGPCACSTAGTELKGAVGDAFARYIGLLGDEEDRAMLAHAYERELYYRFLKGPMAATLRQVAQRDERTQRIKTAADWLSTHHDKPVVMAELAASVGMSLTSFHRHFKAVTGHSPLVFQRQMRLLEARRLLVSGNLSVAKVAYAVGYLSAPQFSREYKGMFGTPPVADFGASDRLVVV
nr:AraC family transcriptional regulator [uncultured Novosphingobium sp.]